jgi:hypothetical protein
MVELSIGVPQIVMLVLYVCNAILSIIHHGEEQEPYNAWTTMLGIAVNFAILKWGGFF